MTAQLANLECKSSQPASHAQPIQGSRSLEGPPKLFYCLSHDAMVREYVISNAHNLNFTPKFATSFCPSYFETQEVSVAPKVSTTRQVIQTNGFASSSSTITRGRRARIVMPQSFRLINMEKDASCWQKGKETTTPQAARASNSCVPRVHVH